GAGRCPVDGDGRGYSTEEVAAVAGWAVMQWPVEDQLHQRAGGVRGAEVPDHRVTTRGKCLHQPGAGRPRGAAGEVVEEPGRIDQVVGAGQTLCDHRLY